MQFAISPFDGRVLIIEMNPRVSRSSALASKATGFPIAKVAAKLAVGYTLDELKNDITGGATPVVRAVDRLRGHQDSALHVQGSSLGQLAPDDQMKSVGEGHGDGPLLRGHCRRRCAASRPAWTA
ncbi:MAG: hypothetical protein R3E65_05750 [Steroidobacteraceae bacterium]